LRKIRSPSSNRPRSPAASAGQVSILEGRDLARLLDYACSYRTLFELLAYTGLRIGEALGLTWADIDQEAELIHVHRQLGRDRSHAPLKTEAAKREVILPPALVRLLREQRLATLHKAPHDLVFTTARGRRLDYRHVGHGFRNAVRRADPPGARPALAPFAPARLRLAADRRGDECRLCLPPARPREPEHHP
jgi:integrase